MLVLGHSSLNSRSLALSLGLNLWSLTVVVVQSPSCVQLCDPTDCIMPGLPVPHHLLEFALVHVHCIGDAIQSSHSLMPSTPSALNLSQHQGLQ